jgi:hypothetical protein
MVAGLLGGICNGTPGMFTLHEVEAQQLYTPPFRGAPASRVGGGTRAPGDPLPFLTVLTPEHTGLTMQEQPVLYWYLSQTATQPVAITINSPKRIEPLLELRLEPPVAAGLHPLRLAEHGLHLTPGAPYEWFVALLTDAENPSKEVVAGGGIERIAPTAERKLKVDTALQQASSEVEAWRIYATSGLWYDAVAALVTLLDKAPPDTPLRQQFATMLDEVGLPEVAQYVKQRQ